MYGTVRRCRTLQKNATFRCFQRRSVCVCVNAAVEINVLDYNFAIRRRTSSYVNVRRRTRCERGFSLRLRIVCQKKR